MDVPIPPLGVFRYTSEVTHLRIWQDEPGIWNLDAADHQGNYTEVCWSHDTHQQAVEAIPAFLNRIRLDGVRIVWRSPRAREV